MESKDLIQKAAASLKKNRFNVVFTNNKGSATRVILDLVPLEATVGISDSATLRQMSIIDALEKRGDKVINPFIKTLTMDLSKYSTFQRILRESLRCDVFLTSTNAITMDGKLVDVDGVGNRIAGTIFGPKKVILAVGRNKIVANVDQALKRIRNVIAPAHAKAKKRNVPCVTKGECVDCNSRERLCNILTIIEKKPSMGDITVILINEDLGLGWDSCWSKERQEKIESQYGEVTWEFILPWHPKAISE